MSNRRTSPTRRPLTLVLSTFGIVLAVACPPVTVILITILGISWMTHRGQRQAAKKVAQYEAYQRWQRDMVLAAKSLP